MRSTMKRLELLELGMVSPDNPFNSDRYAIAIHFDERGSMILDRETGEEFSFTREWERWYDEWWKANPDDKVEISFSTAEPLV